MERTPSKFAQTKEVIGHTELKKLFQDAVDAFAVKEVFNVKKGLI